MKNRCKNCGQCCLNTEMILSENDLTRILENNEGVHKDDIVFLNDGGFYQLKNVDDHCVFYDEYSGSCKIYSVRPKGCQFYPLIYDLDEDKCVLDDTCPHPEIFYESTKKKQDVCIKIKRFIHHELKLYLPF